MFGPGDRIPLGNAVPPLPPGRNFLGNTVREKKCTSMQGIQSGGGGGLNSLTELRFDFDSLDTTSKIFFNPDQGLISLGREWPQAPPTEVSQ